MLSRWVMLLFSASVMMVHAGCHYVFPFPDDPGSTARDAGRDQVDTNGVEDFSASDGRPGSDLGPPSCAEARAYNEVGWGEISDPFQICNESQLRDLFAHMEAVSGDVYQYFTLEQDIRLEKSVPSDVGGHFQGSFDGQGFEISGLRQPLFQTIIEASDPKLNTRIVNLRLSMVEIQMDGEESPVGALAQSNMGELSNIRVEGQVMGQQDVGGVVGKNYRTMTGCEFQGRVSGDSRVGGLVGTNTGGITGGTAVGIIVGQVDVGGLVGRNDQGGTLAQSASHAQVGSPLDLMWKIKGGLAGENAGTINESFATGQVIGDDQLGGLVGVNGSTGVIQHSYALGKVQGNTSVGGLVGANIGGNVERSYAAGRVLGAGAGDTSAGGLVGLNNEGTYKACVWNKTLNYSLPAMGAGATNESGTQIFGRLQGELVWPQTFENLGWDSNTPWILTDGGLPYLSSVLSSSIAHGIRNGRKIGGLDQDSFEVWGICEADGEMIISGDASGQVACAAGDKWTTELAFSAHEDGPVYIQVVMEDDKGNRTVQGRTFLLDRSACSSPPLTDPFQFQSGNGTISDPYVICNQLQLSALQQEETHWDKSFALGDNIVIDITSTDAQPIGNSTVPFTGTFDGNGFEVRGLELTRSGDNETLAHVGLFGVTEGAQIKNLVLRTSKISLGAGSAGSAVGSLVGWAKQNTTITDCEVLDSTVTSKAQSHTGGLVGTFDSGTIGHCTFSESGTVFSENSMSYTGGLVGKLSNSTLRCSRAAGNVIGWHYTGGLVGSLAMEGNIFGGAVSAMTVSGHNFTGGLVGGAAFNSQIEACSVSGVVRGQEKVGGVFGDLWGVGEGCSSYAEVSGTRAVGGLAGILSASGRIERSYALGAVTAEGTSKPLMEIEAGGLVGVHQGAMLLNSFARGPVTAIDSTTPAQSRAGGLVGSSTGYVMYSYAANGCDLFSCGVKSNHTAGGLVGQNDGVIQNCFTASNVEGGMNATDSCGPFQGAGEMGIELYYLDGNNIQCGNVIPVPDESAKSNIVDLYSLPESEDWNNTAEIWFTTPLDQNPPTDFPALR